MKGTLYGGDDSSAVELELLLDAAIPNNDRLLQIANNVRILERNPDKDCLKTMDLR